MKLLTTIDVGQLNIWNRHNKYLQALILISNQVPNSFISEIEKYYKSISKYSIILAIPIYILLVYIPLTKAPLTQTFWAKEISPISVPLTQVLPILASLVSIQDVSKILTLKIFVSSNQVINYKNLMLINLPT